MNNTFSESGIAALRTGPASAVDVRVVDETGSTNADLMGALERLSGPVLLIARRQTAGRGRAGRSWHSAPGASLTFSLAWKFELPLQSLVGLPLAVGVAVAEALAMFEVPTRLKWPNDLLHEGRKLAGILIESARSERAVQPESWAVIGIGINMAVGAEMAARIGQPAAAIPWLAELDQDMLLATLLNALASAMHSFAQHGLGAFVARWNALHAYTGRPVSILDNGVAIHQGVAVGVDESGRFLVDTARGRIAVMAGDVSLRPMTEA